ncbi:hypothetical protein [uncultured Desulfovibrio sp.]|uniref:hypothetical protein n=1 Tax=uncultured Desulfovibrio sp. TaxID=167968 RepID=UPI00261B0E35|nr:hypothetical protein [uncultured Desulfovibrio sp.]
MSDSESIPESVRLNMIEADHEFLAEAYNRQKKQLDVQEHRIRKLEEQLVRCSGALSELVLAFSRAGWGEERLPPNPEVAHHLQ